MARRPDTPCALCGALMWRGSTSLPPGQATCLACRRAQQLHRLHWSDEGDALPHLSAHARVVNDQRRARANLARRALEKSAPGLDRSQRESLRKQWISQSRACTYCPSLATQVDHVVPLVRGGTNYEGNLTPACARCNRRKSHRLVIEWRTKRRIPVRFLEAG